MELLIKRSLLFLLHFGLLFSRHVCAKRCHHACPLLLYTVGNVSHPSYNSRIVVGAPRGNTSSLATGLVYVCPITPGSCQLLTNNTGDLADSMLEGGCAWVAVCLPVGVHVSVRWLHRHSCRMFVQLYKAWHFLRGGPHCGFPL